MKQAFLTLLDVIAKPLKLQAGATVKAPRFAAFLMAACMAIALTLTNPDVADAQSNSDLVRPSSPAGWYHLVSTDGNFSAYFPSQPQYSSQKLPIASFNLTQHSYRLSQGPLGYFEIGYIDYPEGYNNSDLILEGAISGGTRSFIERGGKLISNTMIEHLGCGGREVVVSGPGSSYTHVRVFMSGRRLYMGIYGSESDTPSSRRIGKQFLDSFAVEGGCADELNPVETPSSEVKTSTIQGEEDSQTGWKRISPARDGFSVLMPTAATVEEQQAQVKPFPLTNRTYSSGEQDAVYLAIVSGDFPDNLFTDETSYQIALDGAIAVFQKDFQTTLASKVEFVRNLRIGAYPGREYKIISGERTIGQLQCFITPKRMYFFMAVDSSQNNLSLGIRRFFSSIIVSVK